MSSDAVGIAGSLQGELDAEDRELVRFENAEAYFAKQSDFLAAEVQQSESARPLLEELVHEIQVYQEHAYLLDPYLERLVAPPASVLQNEIKRLASSWTATDLDRLGRYCRLLYVYTKVRGYKVVSRFLPHEIRDMLPLLSFLKQLQDDVQAGRSVHWEVSYILLLWLSLVALIPFSLGESTTMDAPFDQMEGIARYFVTRPGKERDAASVLLGRLYCRRDVSQARMASLFTWSQERMQVTRSSFEATGILQTFCAIAKGIDSSFACRHMSELQSLLLLYDPWSQKSMSVDRFRTKFAGRLALQLLADDPENEWLEDFVNTLLSALGHADSRVRFSASKSLARMAARVPEEMRMQLIEALLEQLAENAQMDSVLLDKMASSTVQSFSPSLVHALDAYDMYAVSDSTWHGVFLALAECMRRALVPIPLLCRVMYWVHRGLLFDIPRGAGAAGSNVRDACCYVLWALARIRQVDLLAPFAQSIAQRLLVVATLDRETSIRRAASAAFQELVGRTTFVPHGITVLRETDFTAVGVLRHAYTVCAPRVAEYDVYRAPLLAHLQHVCLSHWDVHIRQLAASALEKILAHETSQISVVIEAQIRAAQSMDTNKVHGALLALATLSPTLTNAAQGHEVLQAALELPPRLFSTPGGAWILEAACRVIAAVAPLARGESLTLIQTAAARPEGVIHDAVAAAIDALGDDDVVEVFVTRLLDTWTTCTPEEQRSGALALGIQSTKWAEQRRLLLCDAVLGTHGEDVETRRNAATALPAVVYGSPEGTDSVIRALLGGLQDHTTDQRGDVGSWVRAQCLESLSRTVQQVSQPIDLPKVCTAISASVVERIDSVRSTACAVLRDVIRHHSVPARDAVQRALDVPEATFRDARTAFARVIPLLAEDAYREAMLPTLTRTIASCSGSALRDAGQALVDWLSDAESTMVDAVYADLLALAQNHVRDNRVIVPVLQTVQHLLEWDILPGKEAILERLVRVATAYIATLKSLPRLTVSMHITVQALRTPRVRARALASLGAFLTHRYPAIRMNTSEQLLFLLQSEGTSDESLEERLLGTPWCVT